MSHPNIEENEDDAIRQIINNITLECLMNKDQYDKYLTKNFQKIKISNNKDKKFYRKRILQLTRDILANTSPNIITNDVFFSFENYIKTCIQYFKMVDKTDFIQNEHLDTSIDFNNNNTNTIIEKMDLQSTCEIDKQMMRQINFQSPNTLDKFVKITTTKQETQIIPITREINLKDPALRSKGVDQRIRKKKNIDINYDTSKNENPEEENKVIETIIQKE